MDLTYWYLEQVYLLVIIWYYVYRTFTVKSFYITYIGVSICRT